MNTGSKVVVTVLLVIGFFVGGTLLIGTGMSKTFVGLLALGLFYGVKSMWSSPKEEENSDSSEVKLNKDKTDNTDITLNK